MKSAIKDLKLKVDLNYNAKSFLIQTKDAKEIVDEMQRKDNLLAVYEILINKAQLAVNCKDCPFIETCLNKDNRTEDCQVKMIKHIKELGVNI